MINVKIYQILLMVKNNSKKNQLLINKIIIKILLNNQNMKDNNIKFKNNSFFNFLPKNQFKELIID